MGRLSFISLFFFAIIHGEKMIALSKEVDIYWRDYNGTIPLDALSTDHGTFFGQVIVSTCGLVPGTLYPNTRLVVTEAKGKKVVAKSNIKVLCTRNPANFKWQYVNAHQLHENMLENCVSGGFEVGFPLYIGKIFHENEWKIGKVFPAASSIRGLRAWYNSGKVYPVTDFQILMYK